MKVRDLIEKLHGMDPDLTVLIAQTNADPGPSGPLDLRHVSFVERRTGVDGWKTPILALWIAEPW